MNTRRLLLGWVLLPVVAEVVTEQALLAYVDNLVVWQDDAFREYLANPGPRQDSWVTYKCQYRPIAWIYRYRICIFDYNFGLQSTASREYYLAVVFTTGYLTFFPEEGGDRVIAGSRLVWLLDDNLRVIADLRK